METKSGCRTKMWCGRNEIQLLKVSKPVSHQQCLLLQLFCFWSFIQIVQETDGASHWEWEKVGMKRDYLSIFLSLFSIPQVQRHAIPGSRKVISLHSTVAPSLCHANPNPVTIPDKPSADACMAACHPFNSSCISKPGWSRLVMPR